MDNNTLHNEHNLDWFSLVSTGSGFSLYLSPKHRESYEGHCFEPYTVRLVSNLLSRYSLFVDLGASYGFYTLLAGTVSPAIDILALEPSSESFQALERSVAHAGLKNAELHREELRAMKMDGFLAGRTPCPTLVRINAEGHELAVLSGMEETFARFPDLSLLVAWKPALLRAAGHEPEELLRKLDDLGYAVYLLNDELKRHYRLRLDSNNWTKLTGRDGRSNLYCVRKEAALSICFFGHVSGLSGAERSLVSTVSQLIRDHGALCTVIFPARGASVEALEASGAVCLESPGEWWCKPPWSDLGPDAALALKPGIATLLGSTLPLLSEIDPDIIVTETLLLPWGAISAAFLRKPHVWHIHEPSTGVQFFFPLSKILEDMKNCSSLIITCSDAVGKSLFPDLGEEKRRTIYYHIPMPEIPSPAPSSGQFTRKGAVRLALFAYVEERKNQKAAILAVKELVSRGHDVELLLAGAFADPGYATHLRELIAKNGLSSRVKMPGFLPDPYAAMNEADIILACSVFEGFGRTVVEAMLLGKPVVYAAAGGYLESMVDGRTGLAYPPGDIAAFADRIVSLIENPELAAEMGREGRAHALARFSRDGDGGETYRALLKEYKKGETSGGLPKIMEPLIYDVMIGQNAALKNMQSAYQSSYAKSGGLSVPQEQYEQLQSELKSAKKFISELEKALSSVEKWQKSWLKRIFHRWRPPVKLKLRQKAAKSGRKTSSSSREESEVKLIEQSGLFDKTWYLAQYGHQVGNQKDPILHYLRHGAALGFNPSRQFSTQGYLDLYPDVAAAQLNPLLHYIRSGKKEHRNPNVTSMKEVADVILAQFALHAACLSPSKKTVLLVTHEMSRTGAPILVMNIAASMRKNFNVVVLALKPGGLEEEFKGACDLLISSENSREYAYSERLYSRIFQRLTSDCPIQFALVNSIESSAVIKPLWENDVPVIHLIHEFASYTRPHGVFLNSAVYSSLQVYSAALVRDNAILDAPEIREAHSMILPQGRNSAPGTSRDLKLAEEERRRIRTTFRPAGFPEETVVIVGMGTVQIRKGVDLFVMCARQVAALHPKTPFRFVWIGHGYNPEQDLDFSAYIADQIQRSGLKDAFVIMDAVTEIEEAYRQADILFLSSRLDPLPLVSQDAMAHGKPVVCFENATGIAEYLQRDADAAFGVAPYLNAGEAAQRICRLIDDSSHRKQVGEGCRRLVDTVFDFESYVRHLEELGTKEAAEKAREKSDRPLVQSSGLINPEFYQRPENANQAGGDETALKYYMSTWRCGIDRRKPFPGFHPAIYAECNDVHGRDPLAHYIEAGQPDGPWRFPIIGKESPLAEGKTPRVGFHFHLYFPDLAGKIFERIQSIRTPMDLLISVPSKEVEELALSLGSQYTRGRVEVRIVPNRGRDIGPFLTEFGREILAKYDIVGHVHTKKTVDLQDRPFVERWATSLYENLLGCKEPMADNIIGHMVSNEKTGLIFPDDPFVVGWGDNRAYALALAERMNIAHLLPSTALNFPVGTMFWARTAAIRPLLELGLTWDDYPPEPLPYDGSILHAIERILPCVVESTGFTSAVTYVSGSTR